MVKLIFLLFQNPFGVTGMLFVSALNTLCFLSPFSVWLALLPFCRTDFAILGSVLAFHYLYFIGFFGLYMCTELTPGSKLYLCAKLTPGSAFRANTGDYMGIQLGSHSSPFGDPGRSLRWLEHTLHSGVPDLISQHHVVLSTLPRSYP